MENKEVIYEIKDKIGVIHDTTGGWSLEANMVSWNNHPAKVDIRCWKHDEGVAGKGVTMSRIEARKLADMLIEYLDKEG